MGINDFGFFLLLYKKKEVFLCFFMYAVSHLLFCFNLFERKRERKFQIVNNDKIGIMVKHEHCNNKTIIGVKPPDICLSVRNSD